MSPRRGIMKPGTALLTAAAAILLMGWAPGGRAASADKGSAKSPGETAVPEQPDRSKTRGGKAPAKTDTLLISYPNDPDTINGLIANDSVSRDFLRWVYEPLAYQRFADPDHLEPALADSWTFDRKNLLITVKLRRGVKWHPLRLPSGKLLPARDFTARDVK